MAIWLKTALQLSKKAKMITVQGGMIDLVLKMMLLVMLDISSCVKVMFQIKIKIGILGYVYTYVLSFLDQIKVGIFISFSRAYLSAQFELHMRAFVLISCQQLILLGCLKAGFC